MGRGLGGRGQELEGSEDGVGIMVTLLCDSSAKGGGSSG